VRATWTNYHGLYIFFGLLAALMVLMTGAIPGTIPPEWRISNARQMLPLCSIVASHLLAPLVGPLTPACFCRADDVIRLHAPSASPANAFFCKP
jgi:hypothetical protein